MKHYVIESGIKRRAVYTECNFCNKEFLKARRKIAENNYCSNNCFHSSRIRNRVSLECANCGEKFERTISKLKVSKSGLYFCNRACKDIAQRLGGIVEIQPDHYGQHSNKTIGELKELAQNWNITIRDNARRLAFGIYNFNKKCYHCGYGTYVEVCHIKPVSEFGDDATMSSINSKDNLIVLCPNHHKELDFGIISV